MKVILENTKQHSVIGVRKETSGNAGKKTNSKVSAGAGEALKAMASKDLELDCLSFPLFPSPQRENGKGSYWDRDAQDWKNLEDADISKLNRIARAVEWVDGKRRVFSVGGFYRKQADGKSYNYKITSVDKPTSQTHVKVNSEYFPKGGVFKVCSRFGVFSNIKPILEEAK